VKHPSYFFFSTLSLYAQLIPIGTPVPRTAKLPVVFVNGYEYNCAAASFSHTFGVADQVLQANGQTSLFFNYCDVPGMPNIETLAAVFAGFLSGLRYQDGQSVDTVDVVAHSMGGLIVRSYLSGKQSASGVFSPPSATHIRKIVFLGTPHFGTGITMGLAFTPELEELSSGSRFLFDLGTWNQGSDDLRGSEAIAVIGNGGTGLATTQGFDDGVVALTSASLGFYMPGRTRVLPLCHVDGGGLLSIALFCGPNTNGIAHIHAATEDLARTVVSFLNGTVDWKNIGTAAEQNALLAVNGGIYVTVRNASDANLRTDSVTAASLGKTKQLNLSSNDVAYTDMFTAGPATLTPIAGSQQVSENLPLPAAAVDPIVLKPGPAIARVFPAASAVFPLSVAPGMIVSIYGRSLGTQGDAQVLLGSSQQLSLYYAAADQINAVMPESASGLVKLTVQNSAGKNTVNLLVEAAIPAIFTQDGSGKGAAYAVNASTGALVTAGSPLHAGDYMVLALTGLGATQTINGLDYAKQQPTVTIGGKDCPVTYAGRIPGFPGLDQINCIVPTGISPNSAAPVVVTSGTRASNSVTVAVQ